MRFTLLSFAAYLALGAPVLAQAPATQLQSVRDRADARPEHAPTKMADEWTYEDLLQVEVTKRRRILHAFAPDKQYELIRAHLIQMLETHRSVLSKEQTAYLENTLGALHPRDFVRQKMDQATLLRAWRGDRLGRMYRKTDTRVVRELFADTLAAEIFRLQ